MNDKWAMRIDRVLDPIATPIEKLFRFVFSMIGTLFGVIGQLLLVSAKALGVVALFAVGLGLLVLGLAVAYAVARWAYLLVFR